MVEDLQIMIGQQIGLPYLVPITLQRLRANVLAEGAFYPGDLLANVLRVDEQSSVFASLSRPVRFRPSSKIF